jgi:hypothetical protein
LLVTLGTSTTAGTDGIIPHTEFARRLVTIQLGVDVLATIILLGLLVAKIAVRRSTWWFARSTPDPAAG